MVSSRAEELINDWVNVVFQYTVIDRRKNPHGKNLPNRQKFIKRVKEQIKGKIREGLSNRSITSEDGEDITINSDGIDEPNFSYDRHTGDWDHILPGNREYAPGDEIERKRGGSGGRGNKASKDGEGEDDFTFSISKDEYFDILFEDLELPNLVKKSEEAAVTYARKRAGFSKEGSSSALDLGRSMKNSYGRRIALAFPLDRKIKELEEELEACKDSDRAKLLLEEIDELKIRRNAISYIDPVDIRYKRFDKTPVPNTRALMFCIMDVSGSMGEEKKEIAKRFFILLYNFLQTKYKSVDVVFIRHTQIAEEVSEEVFFYDRATGGTIVSGSIELAEKIIKERYDNSSWNIYGVQASDGDNTPDDNPRVRKAIVNILPLMQYYIYMEIQAVKTSHPLYANFLIPTVLSAVFKDIAKEFKNFLIIDIDSVSEVVPKFRKAFLKNDAR